MPAKPEFIYRAMVRRVVDGDTVRCDIDLGFRTWVFNEPLRLIGINAPELRGETREKGLESKRFLEGLFCLELEQDRRPEVIVETEQDKRGKYGRMLARMYCQVPGTELFLDVNGLLVQHGHAEPE